MQDIRGGGRERGEKGRVMRNGSYLDVTFIKNSKRLARRKSDIGGRKLHNVFLEPDIYFCPHSLYLGID